MEYRMKFTKSDLTIIIKALNHYAAKLTTMAWGDLEPSYLEASDNTLDVVKCIKDQIECPFEI